MTDTSAHAHARDYADFLATEAVRAGSNAPSVRGSDWRLATVTVVGNDGTVTADGIPCRRMEAYTTPLVGDLIVISQSSSGNWRAEGRIDGGSGTAWQPYSVGWTSSTNPAIGNGSLLGRYTVLPNRTCHASIRLVPGSGTSFGSGNYLFSVPFTSANDTVEYLGNARLTAGSTTYIGQCVLGPNSNVMNATFPQSATPATAANMSGTVPVTFASGHILRISLTYQTA